MSEKKRKHLSRLSRKCPECEGTLEKIEYQETIRGVIYSTIFIECLMCNYSEKIPNKRNKKIKLND